MILVLACTCGGVDQLARTALKEGGHPNWLNFAVAKGRSESIHKLETIEPLFGDTPQYKALHDKLGKGSGKYVIVLGCDPESHRIRWADIGRGKVEDMMDAQIIVSEYK